MKPIGEVACLQNAVGWEWLAAGLNSEVGAFSSLVDTAIVSQVQVQEGR
jgi:hypothetical protein